MQFSQFPPFSMGLYLGQYLVLDDQILSFKSRPLFGRVSPFVNGKDNMAVYAFTLTNIESKTF